MASFINTNVYRSIGAVVLGTLAIIIPAVVIDTALQFAGVFPFTGEKKFADWQSMLALSYHVPLIVVGGYLAAWLASKKPLAHALTVGAIGFLMSILGQIAIELKDLAPTWYGWMLIVFAFPAAGLGGFLHILQRRQLSLTRRCTQHSPASRLMLARSSRHQSRHGRA